MKRSSELQISRVAYNDHLCYIQSYLRGDVTMKSLEERCNKIKKIQDLKFKAYNAQNKIIPGEKDERFIVSEQTLKETIDEELAFKNIPNEKFIVMHVKLDPNHLTIEEIFYRDRFQNCEKIYINSAKLVYRILHDRTDIIDEYKGLAASPAEKFGLTIYERFLIWKEINYLSVFSIPFNDDKALFTQLGKILSLTIYLFSDEEEEDFTIEYLYEKGKMFYEAHFSNLPRKSVNYYSFYEYIFLPIIMQFYHLTDYCLLKELLLISTFYYTYSNKIEWIDNDGEKRNIVDMINLSLYSAMTTFEF